MVFICLKACFTQAISRTPLNGEREPHVMHDAKSVVPVCVE